MDVYQFIASLVGSLAWPMAGVIIATTQRKPITRLIDRVRNAKLFGAEVDVGEQIEAVREKIEEVRELHPNRANQVAKSLTPAVVVEDQRVKVVTDALAATSAVGTVIAAWAELEDELLRASGGDASFKSRNPADKIYNLTRSGVLPSGTADAIMSLRRVRNEVAHGKHPTMTLEEAINYRNTAEELVDEVRLAISNREWR